MSIKDFHIVFIICSIILCVFLGVWAMNNNSAIFAVLGFLSAIALLVYAVFFIKKMQSQAMKTLLIASLLFSTSTMAEACSVCFKDPNSKMTIGLSQAVFVMLGFLFLIFIAFIKFIYSYNKRTELLSKT